MRDIMGLMKQAQAMQQKLQDAQAELDTIEVEGTAGGGVVLVKVTGKGALKAINIDPSLMNADEKENSGGSYRRGHERCPRQGRSGRARPDGGSHQGHASAARPEDVLRASWRNP